MLNIEGTKKENTSLSHFSIGVFICEGLHLGMANGFLA